MTSRRYIIIVSVAWYVGGGCLHGVQASDALDARRDHVLEGAVKLLGSDRMREVTTALYVHDKERWSIVSTQVATLDGEFVYCNLQEEGRYMLVVLPALGSAGHYPRKLHGPFTIAAGVNRLVVGVDTGVEVEGNYVYKGKPVANAEITFWKPSEPQLFAVRKYTRDNGDFSDISMESGEYILEVRHEVGGAVYFTTNVVINDNTNIILKANGDPR